MSSSSFDPTLNMIAPIEVLEEFGKLWDGASEEHQDLFIAMIDAGLASSDAEKRVEDLRQILAGNVLVEGADRYPTLYDYGRYMFDSKAWKYVKDSDDPFDCEPREFYEALTTSINYESFGNAYLDYGEGFDPNGTVKGKIVKLYA